MLRRAATRVTVRQLRPYSTQPDPQLQGYPQLPDVSRQRLPPLGWDDVQNRRNIGDTLHEKEELYGMWGPDVPHVEPNMALRHFLLAFSLLGGFGYLLYKFPPESPVVPKFSEPTERILVSDPAHGLAVLNGTLLESKDHSSSHH